MILEISLIADFKPAYNVALGGKGTRPKFQPIICVTDNKRYLSTQSAAQAYGLCKSRITQLCKTGRSTKSGLQFAYDGQIGKRASPRKTVVCLDDGLIYESALVASRAYNIHPATIADACRGYYAAAHGRHFAYCESDLSEETRKQLLADAIQRAIETAERKKRASTETNGRAVICLTDGKQYQTAAAANKAYHLGKDTVGHCCRSGASTQNGLRFMYADQEQPLDPKKPRGWYSRKPIICLDNGIVYESLTAAGKAINRSDNAIYHAIRRNKTCVGMRFAYAA